MDTILQFSYFQGDSRDRLNKTIYIHFSNEKPFYKKKTRQYTLVFGKLYSDGTALT